MPIKAIGKVKIKLSAFFWKNSALDICLNFAGPLAAILFAGSLRIQPRSCAEVVVCTIASSTSNLGRTNRFEETYRWIHRNCRQIRPVFVVYFLILFRS